MCTTFADLQTTSIKFPETPVSPVPRTASLNTSLLKKCSGLREFQQFHAQILKVQSPLTPISLAKLVESLVNSSYIDYARKVFDEMSDPSTFIFNTMIRGHNSNGARSEAIEIFFRMQIAGVEPDGYTLPFLLQSCTSLKEGKEVHSLILKTGQIGLDVYSQTSLINLYSSLGDLACARKVFDRMPSKNVVSWTAMLTGYMKQMRYNEGLALFHQMQDSDVEPNELTLVNVLSACANLGAYEMGKWVHEFMDRKGILVNPMLGASLVDMYAKCGRIKKASQVFERLPHRSVFTWNAMIGGLAMHGFGEKAVERFSEMLSVGIAPDDITFIGVLSACAHSGLVQKGKDYFYLMKMEFGVEPNIKHYGCLVDLLGRAGRLDEAYKVINSMPMAPNGVIWGTLLQWCSSHGNVELAELVMGKLVELEPFNDGNYVLMSNIYAAKKQWEDAAKVRRLMGIQGVAKTPGCSAVEVGNVVHEFVVSCSKQPRVREIYKMLDEISSRLKAEGNKPKTNHVLLDIGEKEMKRATD